MVTPLWLQRLHSTLMRRQTARSRRKVPARARLRLEALEDRCLLSAVALDPTFGTGGIQTINLNLPAAELDNVFVQPDGKLVGVGLIQLPGNDYALMLSRYQANGKLDTTYGTGGIAVEGLTSQNYVAPNALGDRNVACTPDGSVIIRGDSDVTGNWLAANQLTRYRPDGSLDMSFGSNGVLTVPDDNFGVNVQAFAVQPDDKILLTGSVHSDPGIWKVLLERLNPDGTLDNSFGTGGEVIADLGVSEPGVGYQIDQSAGYALTVLPDGKILVAGGVTTTTSQGQDGLVARFLSDGSLDTSFGYHGEVVVFGRGGDRATFVGPAAVPFNSPSLQWENGISFMTAQADGKIQVMAGDFWIRLNQDGALDTGFAQNGSGQNGLYFPDVFGAFPTYVRVDVEGRIVFPEEFRGDPVTGYNDFAVTRLGSDGSLDPTFGSAGTGTVTIDLGADSYTQGLAVQSDGKIVLVGTILDASNQGWDIALVRLQGEDQLTLPFSPATVKQELATTVSFLQTSSTDSTLPPVVLAVDPAAVGSVIDAVNALPEPPSGTTPRQVDVVVNLTGDSYSDVTASPPLGVTLVINGNGNSTTIVGHSPALTVAAGNVIVENVSLSTATGAPTILVEGGHLTLRNDVIQESTGYNDAAISVTGGTLDLGTATDPGGNTINVNGTGTFICNTTANPSGAIGDTFERNGQVTAWPAPLTVTTGNSLMLVGHSPPPLTGSVNATPFTGAITYTTAYGDSVTVTLSTAATSASAVGQYSVTPTLSGASAGNYAINPATSTVGTMYVVSVGADPSSTTGAQSVVFWDNKGNAKLITAADLSSLDALNLVTQGGSAFDPKAVQQLQAWLSTSPNATTSYQLAVQLAVIDLNVLAGYVQTTDLLYAGSLLAYQTTYGITGLTSGGFISVQNLMNAANAMLALDPKATSGDPNQPYEAALAHVLQAANGNSDFVQQELLWNLVSLYPSL